MPGSSHSERLRAFSDFTSMPDDAAAVLADHAQTLSVEAERMLNTQGAPCSFFPLVLTGSVRIFVMDEDGREITLYRLGPGQGCVLAATCAVTDTPSPGFTVVENAGEALVIEAAVLRQWIDRFVFWRHYVFTLVARELGNVVAVANELAFQRLDARIAAFLLRSGGDRGDEVHVTHEAVAREVGSRREVVSRILKGFEHQGVLALERGVIRVTDHAALSRRVAPEHAS